MSVLTEFQLEYTLLEDDLPPVAAILVAAGNATRMGGSKQMLPLLGVPVLARSMRAFQDCAAVRDIIVVARSEERADIANLAEQYGITKLTDLVDGGEQRQHSVENGLQAVAEDVGYIAIHDGARPLVTPAWIEKTIEAARQWGAAALGVPVKNTIKRVTADGRIAETLPRSHLFAMQTPQVFDVSLYRKALQYAGEHHLSVTDDCQICEAAGYPVHLVEGDYENIKITTPEDVLLAEALLRSGEEKA